MFCLEFCSQVFFCISQYDTIAPVLVLVFVFVRQIRSDSYPNGFAIDTESVTETSIQISAYPGYGFRLPDGRWHVNVSGVAWESPVVFNRRQKMLIKMLGSVMHLTPQEIECDTFYQRVTPFMAQCESRPKMQVKFGQVQLPFNKKTKLNGRFEQKFILDADHVASLDPDNTGRIPFQLSTQENGQFKKASASSQVLLMPRAGISIITDIDDTIKESTVSNRRELLHNTFIREFRSIRQMPQTYRHWKELGSDFHYVSSSPWQLFEPLETYREKDGFPLGTVHLRNFRLRDQLLKKVILHRKGKRFAIQKLIRNLSARRFILVGDSGEKDPIIYRKISRKFPGNIIGLFIRELPERPVEPEVWQKICEDLPGGICRRFNDGEDLREKAACLFEKME